MFISTVIGFSRETQIIFKNTYVQKPIYSFSLFQNGTCAALWILYYYEFQDVPEPTFLKIQPGKLMQNM